jgi:chromosome segregation ATPase
VIAMNYVLDELRKSLKYHLRQMEDNSNKISHYEEAQQDLKTRNERHKQAITEIGEHIEAIEKGL